MHLHTTIYTYGRESLFRTARGRAGGPDYGGRALAELPLLLLQRRARASEEEAEQVQDFRKQTDSNQDLKSLCEADRLVPPVVALDSKLLFYRKLEEPASDLQFFVPRGR